MSWFRAVLHTVGLIETAVIAISGSILDSAVISAIVGGVFLMVNTALTLWLARRYDRAALASDRAALATRTSGVQQGTDHQEPGDP